MARTMPPRQGSCLLTSPRATLMPLQMSETSRAIPGEPLDMESGPWQCLDIATNQTYVIPDTFITSCLHLFHPLHKIRRTMAAAGGLIYAVYTRCTHVVCSPQQREVRRIPAPSNAPRVPGHDYSVAMVVDTDTQHYRIFLVGVDDRTSVRTLNVEVYDSRVRAWTYLCRQQITEEVIPGPSVVLNGRLYTLMFDLLHPGRHSRIDSFDLDVGTCRSRLTVLIPQGQSIKLRSQPVVASGSLFVVEFSTQQAVISVIIWKVERGRLQVAHLPDFFNYDPSDRQSPTTLIGPVSAIGCGDSIVVCSYLGHRRRWDVLYGTWHELEPFLPEDPPSACHSFFAGPFNFWTGPMPP